MKKLFYFKQSLLQGLQLKTKAFIVLLLFMFLHSGSINAQTIPTIEWLKQYGTITGDACQGISARENIYMSGWTVGSFPGYTYDGVSFDAFLIKFDDMGNSQWASQINCGSTESGYVVTSDHSGVYTNGIINGGTFPGQTNYGYQDFYIRKYDHSGNLLWMHQYGTDGYEMTPEAIAADATGVYMACQTTGTFPGCTNAGGTDFCIIKYSPDGEFLWNRQVGTSNLDNCNGLYADSTGLYICGRSTGNLYGHTILGQADAFIAKYTPDGDTVWTRLFGTNLSENAYEIYGNSSGIYVSGNTNGIFPGQSNAGGNDAYIAKYDRDGNRLWIKEFGTAMAESPYGISANVSGVYVSGITNGTFPGETQNIGNDIFMAGYSNNGDLLWLKQLGSAQKPASTVVPNDYAYGISVVSLKAYVGGYTSGNMPGQTSLGGSDGLIIDLLIQTPQEATQDLITTVGQLVAAGVLNQGQGNALTVKLQAAIQKMNQGNYNAAINNLNAFINQVNAFYNAGILNDEESYELILSTGKIIDVLEEMLLKEGGMISSEGLISAESLQARNYPNPFSISTMICYTLPGDLDVKLKVFDSQGREIITLVDGLQSMGEQSIIFNSENLPGGIYYYRLEAGNSSITKKLIVVK